MVTRLRPCVRPIASSFQALWDQWWLVTLAWYVCALYTQIAVKHASQKGMVSMITMFSNLVIGWPLLAPFALWQGLGPIWTHWRKVVAIGFIAGLEKNLTNTSLYTIGSSLKTALHTFNVIFTFFLAAALGVDSASRRCILGCNIRGHLMLTLAILLVVGGGLVTALFAESTETASAVGVCLQLAAGLMFGLKYVTIKMLLGDAKTQDMYLLSRDKPPSSVQVAFVSSPLIGVVSLAFLPLCEKSLELPHDFWGTAFSMAVSITGILLFQLRLTQLTSPLTVAILGLLKDFLTVIYFLEFSEEDFAKAQRYGYYFSVSGVVVYACSLRGRSGLVREDTDSTVGSAVEQDGESGDCPWTPTPSM